MIYFSFAFFLFSFPLFGEAGIYHHTSLSIVVSIRLYIIFSVPVGSSIRMTGPLLFLHRKPKIRRDESGFQVGKVCMHFNGVNRGWGFTHERDGTATTTQEREW